MKYELPSTELIVIEENNYLKFGEYLNDMQCDDTVNKLSLDDLEYVKKLKRENKILKENAEHNNKVVDKVNWENQLLKKENQQLKEQLLVAQTNEETFRLEMKDITKTLGLDENTLFDDVKVCVKNLKDNWIKLKKYIKTEIPEEVFIDTEWFVSILDKMQELEQGSDNNE